MNLMKERAGIRTNREGKRRVKEALLAPQVLAIIGGTVVLTVTLMLAMSVLARAVGIRISSTFIAFAIGVLATASLFVLGGIVIVLSGGVNWIIGARAEQWTDEVLRQLGPEWQIAHNLAFTEGTPPDTWEVDVDHVAVGPGGVFVVESKYSSVPVDLDSERLAKRVRQDAEQASRSAQRVRRLVSDMPVQPPVIPLLVYWGFRVKSPQEPIRRLGRVHVVMGADADRWRSALGGTLPLDPAVVQAIWQRIQQHKAARLGDASV